MNVTKHKILATLCPIVATRILDAKAGFDLGTATFRHYRRETPNTRLHLKYD